MTKQEVDELIYKYHGEMITDFNWYYQSTQFDDRSATINHAFIREFKPTRVLEFGTRTGRCTCDILNALLLNKLPFVFTPYEIDYTLRLATQANIKDKLGMEMMVGEDVMQHEGIIDNIDYLFVDNSHDMEVTEWLFNTLIKRCIPGALVQIHDLPIKGDFEKSKTEGVFPETDYVIELHKQGKLPLEKVYWGNEENPNIESTWWRYKP